MLPLQHDDKQTSGLFCPSFLCIDLGLYGDPGQTHYTAGAATGMVAGSAVLCSPGRVYAYGTDQRGFQKSVSAPFRRRYSGGYSLAVFLWRH